MVLPQRIKSPIPLSYYLRFILMFINLTSDKAYTCYVKTKYENLLLSYGIGTYFCNLALRNLIQTCNNKLIAVFSTDFENKNKTPCRKLCRDVSGGCDRCVFTRTTVTPTILKSIYHIFFNIF